MFYVIEYTDNTYNRGMGWPTILEEATHYSSYEDAMYSSDLLDDVKQVVGLYGLNSIGFGVQLCSMLLNILVAITRANLDSGRWTLIRPKDLHIYYMRKTLCDSVAEMLLLLEYTDLIQLVLELNMAYVIKFDADGTFNALGDHLSIEGATRYSSFIRAENASFWLTSKNTIFELYGDNPIGFLVNHTEAK